jgi:hypothetical protein
MKTLKQFAEEHGLSYSYLTKRHMKYKQAGGWGAQRVLAPGKRGGFGAPRPKKVSE